MFPWGASSCSHLDVNRAFSCSHLNVDSMFPLSRPRCSHLATRVPTVVRSSVPRGGLGHIDDTRSRLHSIITCPTLAGVAFTVRFRRLGRLLVRPLLAVLVAVLLLAGCICSAVETGETEDSSNTIDDYANACFNKYLLPLLFLWSVCLFPKNTMNLATEAPKSLVACPSCIGWGTRSRVRCAPRTSVRPTVPSRVSVPRDGQEAFSLRGFSPSASCLLKGSVGGPQGGVLQQFSAVTAVLC